MKILAKNNKRDIDIKESFTAGLILQSFEIKPILSGHMSLIGSWIDLNNLELVSSSVPPNQKIHFVVVDPNRRRKLLLNRSEVNKLQNLVNKGFIVVPDSVQYVNKKIRLVISVAKKINKADRREYEKEKIVRKELKEIY
jgi:SsrA-binding protein